jgi:hypothetical protein
MESRNDGSVDNFDNDTNGDLHFFPVVVVAKASAERNSSGAFHERRRTATMANKTGQKAGTQRGNRQRFPYEPRVIGGKMMMPAELQAIHRYVLETPVLVDVTEEIRGTPALSHVRAGHPAMRSDVLWKARAKRTSATREFLGVSGISSPCRKEIGLFTTAATTARLFVVWTATSWQAWSSDRRL